MFTQSDLENLAELSRLRIDDTEVEKYREDIESIITFLDELEDVEVSEGGADASNTNVMRDDVVDSCKEQELLMDNAPDTEKGQVKVPKILQK
jgi:aspartyl-tRNA(Asn)/glutamyl-tRNA(Gln) amidotransferase subunit C